MYNHKLSLFRIGSNNFDPYLSFAGGSLSKVHLRYSGAGGSGAFSAFLEAKDMLIGKYGSRVGEDNKKMMGCGEIQIAKFNIYIDRYKYGLAI